MREHPQLAVARRLWDAIAEADVLALQALLSEKSMWRMYGDSPLAGCATGSEEIIQWMARVGELTDDLHSDLIDIFVSERGAVLRYRIRASRGVQQLDVEQLCMIRVEQGRIVEAIFAPIDQLRYDGFFAPQ